ncbi:hypothetical protein H311_00192 [Anncaliia algerae PRA109]|nr:hypothetical protein H311_00192 [Anncaliia algerae PRA109]
MSRKQRVKITNELYELVLKMAFEQDYSTNLIAQTLDITPQTINNIIRRFKNGEKFIDADQKRHTTCETKNMLLKDSEQAMINAITINNSLTLREATSVAAETTGHLFSASKACRILKKCNFTRKRLTLIPQERNSREKRSQSNICNGPISNIRFKFDIFGRDWF